MASSETGDSNKDNNNDNNLSQYFPSTEPHLETEKDIPQDGFWRGWGYGAVLSHPSMDQLPGRQDMVTCLLLHTALE